jgi:hypothetical protein
MRQLGRRVAAILALITLFCWVSSAQTSLVVNESAIRIELSSNGTGVDFPVVNSTAQTISANVLFELVDPRGVVQVQVQQTASIPPGASKIAMTLPPAFAQNGNPDQRALVSYRLRYTITPTGSGSAPVAPISGIISVGAAASGIFELSVAGPSLVKAGGHYAVRVRAIHPVTLQPVAGVSVQASLDIDATDQKPLLTGKSLTDRDGFATLDFTIPKEIGTEEIEVTITGTLGKFSAEANGNLHLNRFSSVSLSTDKAIYQPGQNIHTRLMAFGVNQKAIAQQPVTISILDPERTLVYRTETRTSTFGIAAADWQVPSSLRLGDYQIQANFEDGPYEDAEASATVKISRYELPTFTVIVKPDRAYYLPDQNASVEIQAEYLFGEPVTRGHIRLIQESERTWNYREQKYDTKEGLTFEGDTDEQGRYTAQVDLTKEHDRLAADDYERYHDLTFAAYYTDASTKRTEQRRFDLRLTKNPIHVYVISADTPHSDGSPFVFYVSTDYADGRPVACEVEVRLESTQRNVKNSSSVKLVEEPVRRAHTNRYGVAKVSIPSPARGDTPEFSLNFRARDHQGEIGVHTESMWFGYYPGIRIDTDKNLYKPGESIEVQLFSPGRELSAVVEATQNSEVIASRTVRIRHGHAAVEFAGSDKFQGVVNIVAYAFEVGPEANDRMEAIVGDRAVLFPKDRELKIDLKLSKPVYRPGEEATGQVRVSGADGKAKKSALGFMVVDQAVAEREQTDRDFGGSAGFYRFRRNSDDNSEIGGVKRSDLDKLDVSKPIPPDLDLVAEMLLQGDARPAQAFSSDSYPPSLRELFKFEINPSIEPVRASLDRQYDKTGVFPGTDAELQAELSRDHLALQEILDPWRTPYRAKFHIAQTLAVFEIWSAGPDKKFDTADDFVAANLDWAYFKPNYQAMDRAAHEYNDRTGNCIRDRETLTAELKHIGSDPELWKDPWGHPYRFSFGVDRSQFTITATSAGPDGRFMADAADSVDDFSLATIGIDYFAVPRATLNNALTAYFKDTQVFPENTEQLDKALAGTDWKQLRDPWGHPYYFTFRQEARYSDDLTVKSYEDYSGRPESKTKLVPVTQRINWIYVRSGGEDGVQGSADDFDVASFSRGVVEQSSKDENPVPSKDQPVLSGSKGAVSGTVTDFTGAVIPNAEINAKNLVTEENFIAKTGGDGVYLLRNLPAGLYQVQITSLGFRVQVVTNVPVRSSNVTQLSVQLAVGTASQTIEVQGEAVRVQTEMATVSGKASVNGLPLVAQVTTPRVREYFPETLYWAPEIDTDDQGRTRVNFPLADSITTWKLSAVASTVDGEIGTVEKDIRSFQPFFIEHDPPRFLTVGDEITLPVVLRNYLDRKIELRVDMKPAGWFEMLSSATVNSSVAARGTTRDEFGFRATTAVTDGKQKVVATGKVASDAISRPITVRPNGEQKTLTTSQVFTETASMDFEIPAEAIAGSAQTRIKIYPNLLAHVIESIEAILERPYGCGEQTISSTYPSVLLLKFAGKPKSSESPVLARARRYAELGYQRLLSYRAPSGGFTYWGHGDEDPALTAYAIQFLTDASEFVEVDPSVIQEATSWLIARQQSDGRWVTRDWNQEGNSERSTMLTAYVASVLASSSQPKKDSVSRSASTNTSAEVVRKALAYLKPRVDSVDEPYMLASYALAAEQVGDHAGFKEGITKLRGLQHSEDESSYWSLETNTPFYGWGRTGRIETTALVLQALAKDESDADGLISRGLLFLLRNQDRYGIWYSTQATINVLKTMGDLLSDGDSRPRDSSPAPSGSKMIVTIDGGQTVSADLPPANMLSGPVELDLTKFVPAGKHHIEFRSPAGSQRSSVQLIADYYVPWVQPRSDSATWHDASSNEALKLSVHFDKPVGIVGDDVRCSIEAERIGFRGYGMLLAEIGLPPGAEVDRSSIDRLVAQSQGGIEQYDVLPDRVIFYLWPHAGGSQFAFDFKLRYGVKALNTSSVLYDYYNPDEQITVAPMTFTVGEK